MKWEDYSDDESHPNASGHEFLTKALDNYFEKAAVIGADAYTMPTEPLYGNDFENCRYYDAENLKLDSIGSFVAGKTMEQFPNGWLSLEDGSCEPLCFTVTAKKIIAVYKQTALDTWGNAKASVNGSGAKVLMGCSPSGWGGPAYSVIYSVADAEKITAEITTTQAYSTKTFQLVAFGIVE